MTSPLDLPFEEPAPDHPSNPNPLRQPAACARVLTVSELTCRIRDLLETHLFEVWVEGEISNCRVWNTGHLYFTLKDAVAQVRARDVPVRAALPASSNPKTASGDRARPHQRL